MSIDGIVERFGRAFAADLDQALPPPLGAERLLLGPLAVARARPLGARRAPIARRVADFGVESRVTSPGAPPTTVDVLSDAPCAATVAAIVAVGASAEAKLRLRIDPRASSTERLARAALEPWLTAGRVTIEPRSGEGQDGWTVGGGRATILCTPYYYDRGDLERLAHHVALEVAEPSPDADAGVDLVVASGWEQRGALISRVEELLAKWEAPRRTSLATEVLDAGDARSALEALAARKELVDGRALALFVYPMWRERTEVDRALEALCASSARAVVNGRPTLAWAFGVASPARAMLTVDLRMTTTPRRTALDNLVRFAMKPSLTRAPGAALRQWVGWP